MQQVHLQVRLAALFRQFAPVAISTGASPVMIGIILVRVIF
jgi:hypothetical protein